MKVLRLNPITGRPRWSSKLRGTAGIALIFAISVAGCVQSVREPVPTGVEVQPQPDGRTMYLATARASAKAIEFGSVSLKQTTSCDAARMLMENEFQDRQIPRPNFSKAEFFLIYDAEYCRVRIIR